MITVRIPVVSGICSARVLQSLRLRAWMGKRAWRVKVLVRRLERHNIVAAARMVHLTLVNLRVILSCLKVLVHARIATRTTIRQARLHVLLRLNTQSLFAPPLTTAQVKSRGRDKIRNQMAVTHHRLSLTTALAQWCTLVALIRVKYHGPRVSMCGNPKLFLPSQRLCGSCVSFSTSKHSIFPSKLG